MAVIALVSTLLGIFGGAVPKILDEVRDSRAHTREMENMKLQADLQLQLAKQTADSKLREIEAQSVSAQFQAMAANLTEIIKAEAGRTTGIAWLDAANATLRPLCAFTIMGLFMTVSAVYTWGVLHSGLSYPEMATIIFGSMVGEAFQAVMGYVFGYRSIIKR